jgi:hypothetical protein
VLLPVYLLWKNSGLLDTVSGLIIIYTLINLPIAVWMAFTYFCEVPKEILEAARIDGANTWQEIIHLLLPMSLPGLASTGLLLLILSWNEAFWSINLSSSHAAPLTVFIASYSSPEGLFWAKLSAASCWLSRPSWCWAGWHKSSWYAALPLERSSEPDLHPSDQRLRRRAAGYRSHRLRSACSANWPPACPASMWLPPSCRALA